MDALKSLLDNEKGLVGILIIIGATIFVVVGSMTIEDWKTMVEWIFTAYVGSTAIHESSKALASKSQPQPQPEQK